MIIVVGGSGRKAGKTLLAERLIRAFPEACWLAVKISRHAHGTSGWRLDRQEAPDPANDTGRFLAAGACEAWWLRAEQDRLAEAIPELRGLLSRFENVILESNSIAEHISPDIYLFVASGKVTVKRMPPGG
jgi:molybdopterin-guanine dinucleotide biosynthesis protein